jgi:hypothetical protein
MAGKYHPNQQPPSFEVDSRKTDTDKKKVA